jgi:hypothetical protein
MSKAHRIYYKDPAWSMPWYCNALLCSKHTLYYDSNPLTPPGDQVILTSPFVSSSDQSCTNVGLHVIGVADNIYTPNIINILFHLTLVQSTIPTKGPFLSY